jgi:Fe-S-cluster-containing dehydrogenase component
LHFNKAPRKFFSIKLPYGHLNFEFVRAASVCVICQEQHEMPVCSEMAYEQSVVFVEKFDDRKEEVVKALYGNLKFLEGKSSDTKLSVHDCQTEWTRISEELALCAKLSPE